jgi:hypothetical protein
MYSSSTVPPVATALAYDVKRVTRDVDARFVPLASCWRRPAGSRHRADARAPQRQDRARVLRESAIADDGVVLTGMLDHGLLSHDVAATDVECARSARAGVLFGRGSGYVLLWGGASFADVHRVAL